MTTRTPRFSLNYEGVNITADIAIDLISLAIVDKLEGESDELVVTLHNSSLKWLNNWLPGEGDSAIAELGYEGEAAITANFEIDAPTWEGPPDRFSLKGLATPIKKSLRQRNNQSYENTTLREIAAQIAEKHDLELVGAIPNISLKRVTQKEQTDLNFLRDLAAEYDTVFKIESLTKLVFYQEIDLESADPVLTIERSAIGKYRINREAGGAYRAARVSYQDPETGEFIEITVDTAGAVASPGSEGAQQVDDILIIRERSENQEQAEVKAKGALRRANSTRVMLDLSLEGNTLLSAGAVFALSGFFNLDGNYLITKVAHTLSRNQGYRSDVQSRKILT